MNIRPIVDWQSPDSTPDVPKYDTKQFWIAIRYKRKGEWHNLVFDAQYVNKPIEYDPEHEDEPLNDDYFVDQDGCPIAAVGWYSLMEHADFDGYYETISFNEEYELLGWGEYLKPEFTLFNEIEQVEKPSERLREIVRLMCADNHLSLKPLEQWPDDVGFCYSNLNEQASLLHEKDFDTFTSGEEFEVNELVNWYGLSTLHKFMEEVFDGYLSEKLLIN